MRIVFSIITLMLFLGSCTRADAGKSSGSARAGACEEIAGKAEDLPLDPFYNDEKVDVAKLKAVLDKVKDIPDINDRVIAITQEFIGTPYVGATLNVPSGEQLYVNTTGLDCLTFVETVISLASAAATDSHSVEDYLRKLRSIRYRDGAIDGYPSRLHYISEWSIDNGRRGNIKEISGECRLSEKKVKTIDFMTRNRNLYPALKDEAVFQAIKENEKPLKDLHYAIIPTAEVNHAAKNFLKSGDIVAIETTKPGLDVSHVGVINIQNGIPYLIHASSKYKKVINDTLPLRDYLKRQGSPGIRVFRLP